MGNASIEHLVLHWETLNKLNNYKAKLTDSHNVLSFSASTSS